MSDKFDFDEEEKNEQIDNRIDSDDNEAVLEVMKRTQMSNEMPIYIEDEIKASYLDYSMSVIVSRALPDVRDGLKPVHRRILFAMNDLGMSNDKPYKKSARIVGEVLGKYHPHGDSAVYNAMVRLAQDFNTRYELVDGHGNFGSVDGDSAAAMRYTEARMAKITNELLVDIDKNTVDFRKNFDESLDEPVVLPAKLPNLLLNGTTGIAVGMATNIPPHNLKELVDAIIALIDNKEITTEELMQYIKGPDFPTGGIIYGKNGIKSAYKTGRGKIKVSSKTKIEKYKNGREAIIITELPYQVNKARLIEKIAEHVRNKKITGISDLRDETDRDGTRIVIELKKGEESELVLNNLFKFTDLQVTYGIIMLALVKNVPKILSLKEILLKYLEHRFEVITRKTQFELEKAKRRLHILEGFRKALDHIDEIIKIIRASKDVNSAKETLIERFDFTDLQARAILDMKLQRLTGLEREKIENEYQNIVKYVIDLEDILSSDDRKNNIIKEEIIELKEKYGDDRRTLIENERDEITVEDLIKNEEVVVTITHKGYVKRISLDAYRSQKRGGLGVSSTKTIDDDLLKNIYTVKTLDKILVFTDKGRVYDMKVYQIPEVSKQARGKLIQNIIKLDDNEKVSVIMPVEAIENDNRELLFVTKLGMAKKTNIEEYIRINSNGKIAIKFKENDELKFVGITSGTREDQVYIATKNGKAIRFKEEDIRVAGRASMGVRAIKLDKDDEVVAADIIYSYLKEEDLTVLTFTSLGFGKRTSLEDYKVIKRGGKGVINYKLEGKNNFVVYSSMIHTTNEHEVGIVAISSLGTVIRFTVKDLSVIGRNTKGVKIQRLKYDEYLVSADRVVIIDTEVEEDIE